MLDLLGRFYYVHATNSNLVIMLFALYTQIDRKQ